MESKILFCFVDIGPVVLTLIYSFPCVCRNARLIHSIDVSKLKWMLIHSGHELDYTRQVISVMI
jgi:hypothetical protein